MQPEFTVVEEMARRICVARGGDWNRRGTKRNYWRRLAFRAISLLRP